MNKASLTATFVCAMGAALSAEAQVSRVFVSVDGNDANVCSNIATPCRTIGGGVTQVDAEGEVIIVSSGSYAGGTISKPVKVDAAAGVVAFSGLPMTVDPGAGKLVVIRGLTIKAATPGTGNAIALTSGRLSVEKSVIDGWEYGINVIGGEQLHVADSEFRGFTNTGIYVLGPAHTSVENTRFVNGGSNAAYRGFGTSTASISGCEITNGAGGIFGFNSSVIFVDNCRITNLTYGLYTVATMRVTRTIVTKNVTGVWNDLGTIESFGTNVFRGNGTDILGAVTPVAMQ